MEATALEAMMAAELAAPALAPAPTALERVAHIAEVAVPIEVELDRKTLTVRQILALSAGSVVKMSRSAGENIDVRVAGVLMGFGEIVILEDTIGVRITDFCAEA